MNTITAPAGAICIEEDIVQMRSVQDKMILPSPEESSVMKQGVPEGGADKDNAGIQSNSRKNTARGAEMNLLLRTSSVLRYRTAEYSSPKNLVVVWRKRADV